MPTAFPDWAQRALDDFKPTTSGFPTPREEERIEWWQSTYNRFRKQWPDLQTETWKISQLMRFSADDVRAHVLGAAMEIAGKVGVGRDAAKLQKSAKEMRELDDQISAAAKSLRGLLRRKVRQERDFRMSDNDGEQRDPLDFWDALELSFEAALIDRELQEWAYVAEEPMLQLIDNARTQSRTGLNWEHFLYQLESRRRGPIRPFGRADADILAATSTKATAWSPWVRLLVEEIDDRGSTLGLDLLYEIGPGHLAALARVAFNASEEFINDEQMRGHIRRHNQRRFPILRA